MKKVTAILMLTAAVATVAACTPEERALNKAPGTYESEATSTDAAGTTTTRKTSTDVSVDNQGKKKAVIKSKTTKDPKGLLNKTTTSDVEEEVREK